MAWSHFGVQFTTGEKRARVEELLTAFVDTGRRPHALRGPGARARARALSTRTVEQFFFFKVKIKFQTIFKHAAKTQKTANLHFKDRSKKQSFQRENINSTRLLLIKTYQLTFFLNPRSFAQIWGVSY